MVQIITMRLDRASLASTQKELRRLGRIPEKIPSQVMHRWGNMLVNDLTRSAIWSGIKEWRGKLLSGGIRWEQRPKGKVGYLKMPLYGVYLDSMKPHHVALKRGRLITQWAREKGFVGRSIFVRPHPYIERGYRLARPKLNVLVKELVRKK